MTSGLMTGLMFVGLAVLALVVAGYFVTYLAFLKKVGPNEVLVVSGRGRVKFITGGADMVIPLFQTWNHLSLEVMTLDVTTPEVYTPQGVPLIVEGVAQIKIKKDEASLRAAAERFLGKEPQEITKIALKTVQGHLRAILGAMNMEELSRNRVQFNVHDQASAGKVPFGPQQRRGFHRPRRGQSSASVTQRRRGRRHSRRGAALHRP